MFWQNAKGIDTSENNAIIFDTMSRRIIVLQKLFCASLVGAVSFLSLLPSLGWAWHRVLPEHEHWFIGAFHEDSRGDLDAIALRDCSDCSFTTRGSAILHTPTFSALQILAIAMGLVAGTFISIPDSNPERVFSQSPNLHSLFLPLLDPPPKAV